VSWPPRPASTRPGCARTSRTSARAACAASATRCAPSATGSPGIGNLGAALADYAGFGSRGFRFVGLFDAAPARVGQRIGGHTVRAIDDLEAVVTETRASIGVITTPAEVAQQVCDRLARAGVRSILNFAPVTLVAPDGVDVRQVDLSVELQVLAFLGQQREAS
jgi:redox-sensing transcriptional repressor